MRTAGAVVVVFMGGVGGFSTPRYDEAHLQRVASINARYEAEHRRADDQYTSLVAALDVVRASLIPTRPGSDAPVRRIDEREDIVACRDQCDDHTLAETFDRSNEPATVRCRHEVCQPAYL